MPSDPFKKAGLLAFFLALIMLAGWVLKDYPRKAYWDLLLQITGCQGAHFKDYPAIAHIENPEWSHLQPCDP